MNFQIKYVVLIAACVLFSSCSETQENNAFKAPASNDHSQTVGTAPQNQNSDGKPIERGPGPLNKQNTSIGGIHIGDSQGKVRSLLGEPTKIGSVHSTPEVEWYYEKENLRVRFYRTGENEPTGGVEWIVLEGPSTLKLNDNIRIGDTVEKLQKSYEKMIETHTDYEGKPFKNYWVTGSTHTEGVYHPYLFFRVDQAGKITTMDLSNHFIDPSQTK
ncbi:hypothetical protein [Paenibacillus turpanensis]|uniref:hypothetical protein n=1 Tax=Paenibacillus turpanensis TaxID=2689078 RepID=UPI00140E23C0|nr:hypothetical protein [Paenibacillus turpanensis]